MTIEEAIKILSDDIIGYAEGHEKYEEAVNTLLAEYENTQSDLYEANNCISDLLDIIKQKEKIINLMAEDLNDFYDDIALEYRERTIEDTIKRFEERCK